MKNIKRIAGTLAVICIFCAGALCTIACSADAAGPKVLVVPFDDKTWEFKDAEEILTKEASEAVAASAGYAYVSPDDLAKNWMKSLTDKERERFGPDPAAQMKNLKQYRPLFVRQDLGTLNEFKDRWGADLAIIGEIRKEGDAAVLHTEIVSIDTGRLYAADDAFLPGEAQELVKRQVGILLAKAGDITKVNADAVVLPRRSIVAYDIKAVSGEYVRIAMDFSSDRPDPDLQNVNITPQRPITDGILSLKVMTAEKKPITFQYFYRQGQFVNMKISTDRPGATADGSAEHEETLTVVSKGGYEVRFIFVWKGRESKNVRAQAVINPYAEVR